MSSKLTPGVLSKFQPLNALNPDNLKQIINKFSPETVAPGSALFKKGDTDDHHIFLLEGKIDLVGDSGVLKTIESDTADAYQPLVHVIPRTVTAKTQTEVTVLRVDSDMLDMMLTWDQTSGFQVQELNSGSDENSDDWMLHLLRTEAFHRIPAANIQAIFMKMETVSYSPGEVIINQGDDGDYFYVIKQGRCLVTRATPNQPKGIKLAELKEGDTFGEEALISDAKRNATVTMLSKGTLSRLSKEDFLSLLNEPSIEKVDFEQGQQLVDSGMAVWLDIRLPTEYKSQHIKGSTNIPLISLRLKMASLDKDKRYIVYCDTGRRSSAASFLLNEHGLDSLVLEGGLNNIPDDAKESDS